MSDHDPRDRAGEGPIPREAPRAPTQAQWDRMSEAQRQRAVDQLHQSVTEEELAEREAMAEGDIHLQTKLDARDTLRSYFDGIGRSLYVGADIKVYYPGEKGFTPDLIAVRDAEQRPRHSWMVSREGKGIDLALEVHDQGSWKKDFVDNVARYAALGISEYFVVAVSRPHIIGYRLSSPDAGRYLPIVADKGRLRSTVLGLDLLLDGTRVRFFHGTAELLGLTEMLASEQARAEAEQARAEAEQARAESATEQLGTALVEILRLRGMTPSDAQLEQVRAMVDPSVLGRWMQRALAAASADAVFADD